MRLHKTLVTTEYINEYGVKYKYDICKSYYDINGKEWEPEYYVHESIFDDDRNKFVYSGTRLSYKQLWRFKRELPKRYFFKYFNDLDLEAIK